MESCKVIPCERTTELPKNRTLRLIVASTLELALEQHNRLKRPEPVAIYQIGQHFYFDATGEAAE